MRVMRLLAAVVLVIASLGGAQARLKEGIWCGDKNCYDVLGLKESVNTTQIITSYRRLAREWHPDKNAHRRPQAEARFAEISHAYDILKNDVTRKDYDYALKHPEQFAYNQYRYYYGQYYVKHVQFNPLLVLIIGLGMWSAFDYMSRSITHSQAIAAFKESPEYKANLKRFKEDTLAELERTGKVKKKMNGKRTKKEIDAVEVDEKVLESQIQVRGGYRKPRWQELAIVQFWLLPYHLYRGIAWQVQWLVRYSWRGEPYDIEAKEYLTRTFFGVSADNWEGFDAKRRAKLLQEEVWLPENEARVREAMKQRARAARDFDDYEPE